MQHRAFRQKLVIGVLLAAIFAIALYLRVALPYDQVFTSQGVIKFTSVDAYYEMRIVDNLVHNFPHLNSFDPYMLYPGGGATSFHFPFYEYLLAGIIWLIGLGSPTQHTIDVVAAYFPAILGALTIIPVYFIGKTLFSRWAGIISAGLLAILPGDFLGRSILGFTRHNADEWFLTTTAMLFLILAIKNAKREPLTLEHLRHPGRTSLTKPVLYSLLAGIFLGIYLIAWQGALLFVFLITVYFIIQFTIDHLRQRPVDYLCLVGAITFLIALIISVPVSRERLDLTSLVVALLSVLFMFALSRLMLRRDLKPAYYPLTLLGLGLAAFGIFYAIDSGLIRSMVDQFGIFSWNINTTNVEMEPLLFPYGSGGGISLIVAWGNFTTSFFLSIIALGILIYLIIKHGEAEKTLLVVWTVVIVVATLAQRRFDYYLAIDVALLAGYLSWQVLRFAGLQGRVHQSATRLPPPKRKRAKAKPRKLRLSDVRIPARWVYVTLTAIVLFFLVFFPNISKARATASQAPFEPSDAWYESLTWLRNNTPDPFGDPNFYYETYKTPFQYPATAYGVTAWWDYGYWIIQIGHRIPSQSPGTNGIPGVAKFFITQDEASANSILDGLGTRYVILDYEAVTDKFYAAVTTSGGSLEDFYDVFYVLNNSTGQLQPVRLYFPEYYQSMCVRLYNFGGEAVSTQRCLVISYDNKISTQGTRYKEITSSKQFQTYEEASTYVSSQKSGNYQIVSDNPFLSPVPLEKVEHYTLIHDSNASISLPSGSATTSIAAVRIFEYVK